MAQLRGRINAGARDRQRRSSSPHIFLVWERDAHAFYGKNVSVFGCLAGRREDGSDGKAS